MVYILTRIYIIDPAYLDYSVQFPSANSLPFEILNGTLQFDIFFNTLGSFALYFRAYDLSNYSMLRIDPSDINTVKLFKM